MKTMLVAVDGSVREAGVLSAAIDLAKKTSCKILLFRAVGLPKDIPLEAFTLGPDEVARLVERNASEDLKKLLLQVPADVALGTRVLFGAPWSAIEQAAREANVDLIVIGAHGYGKLDKMLGTTASKVVNNADRPVLVLRDPAHITA